MQDQDGEATSKQRNELLQFQIQLLPKQIASVALSLSVNLIETNSERYDATTLAA